MKPFRYLPLLLGAAVVFAPLQTALAKTELGVLKCKTVPGTRHNLLIRSTADVVCQFEEKGGKVEEYKGETGIAVGLTLTFDQKEEKLYYTVISNTTSDKPGALAGKYVGGALSGAVGKGAGVAVLVGGGDNNFTLQPLGGTTGEGFGASAGVGFLYIEPKK